MFWTLISKLMGWNSSPVEEADSISYVVPDVVPEHRTLPLYAVEDDDDPEDELGYPWNILWGGEVFRLKAHYDASLSSDQPFFTKAVEVAGEVFLVSALKQDRGESTYAPVFILVLNRRLIRVATLQAVGRMTLVLFGLDDDCEAVQHNDIREVVIELAERGRITNKSG